MSRFDFPCLSLAITRLQTPGLPHFATWILEAPSPSGYAHYDAPWSHNLSQIWQAWLELFSPTRKMPMGILHQSISSENDPGLSSDFTSHQSLSYSSRLMQKLGLQLWQWLFEGSIQTSLHESRGIAIGQNQPLRIRLDVREPNLIDLPWEIMQPQGGQPAISLSPQFLFSRTTSYVNPLAPQYPQESLKILLILGDEKTGDLQLEEEANTLNKILQGSLKKNPNFLNSGRIKTLVQPTPTELITHLETGDYNIFFYAGHGTPSPDGGLLKLTPNISLNGTELAQILVRCHVILAVFNSCWGAQPFLEILPDSAPKAIPGSSLAEVLIHHGLPAVLAMRDAISDPEALTFIQTFTQGLMQEMTIDQAVTFARQQLLTLYKFNQPAWTLPVLYMHPEFNGELLEYSEDITTELPQSSQTRIGQSSVIAYLRSQLTPEKIWSISSGIVKIGRGEGNHIIIPEQWVSQQHAEIFCRHNIMDEKNQPTYFLRDFSRYGTLIDQAQGWQRIHHQEVSLKPGTLLKFGSSHGQTLEFVLEG